MFCFKVVIGTQYMRTVNKPSDANVCSALCHNTAFIFVTYDPQITHDKQIGNRKKTFWKKQGTLSETNY